jgi:hypothetical protein
VVHCVLCPNYLRDCLCLCLCLCLSDFSFSLAFFLPLSSFPSLSSPSLSSPSLSSPFLSSLSLSSLSLSFLSLSSPSLSSISLSFLSLSSHSLSVSRPPEYSRMNNCHHPKFRFLLECSSIFHFQGLAHAHAYALEVVGVSAA